MKGKLFMVNFSKYEQRKLFNWALFGCFVMALSFFAHLNSFTSPLSLLNFQLTNSSVDTKEYAIIIDASNYQGVDKIENQDQIKNSNASIDERDAHETQQDDKIVDQDHVKNFKPNPAAVCNFSLPRSDFCEINGNVRIHGNSSTIYIPPSLLSNANITFKVRPYARKIDRSIMSRARELTLGSPSSFGLNEMPHCSINHKIPAIVFSVGGYSGNFFHSLTDILVPLYITSRPFNGEVQFLVTNIKLGWIKKYRSLLSSLSIYPIIDVDSSNQVHCFPSMIVGLRNHKEFSIDPSKTPQGYSMRSFTQFIRSVYSLKRNKVKKHVKKPRLLIISRRSSRAFLNVNEVATEAKRLGYNVVITEGSRNMEDFSKMVNSFDVVVGVHGAGLTNTIFLPEKAVLIQVVPIGLDWISKLDFQLPAIDMNLRYLEYKISAKESSLSDEYSLEDPMIRKPSMKGHDWIGFKKAYLDGQSVRIDVSRFRATLVKALELLRQ